SITLFAQLLASSHVINSLLLFPKSPILYGFVPSTIILLTGFLIVELDTKVLDVCSPFVYVILIVFLLIPLEPFCFIFVVSCFQFLLLHYLFYIILSLPPYFYFFLYCLYHLLLFIIWTPLLLVFYHLLFLYLNHYFLYDFA